MRASNRRADHEAMDCHFHAARPKVRYDHVCSTEVVSRVGRRHPEHVGPCCATGLQAGRGVFDDEAPANVEAERPGRQQIPLRVGLTEPHIFGRHQHVRHRKPGDRQARTHERPRTGSHRGPPAAWKARQQVARGRECGHLIEVGQLQTLKLGNRGGALAARKKLSHRVLRAPPVTDPENLRVVDPARCGPRLPGPHDRSGGVHQRPIDVEQDRVDLKAHGQQPTGTGARPRKGFAVAYRASRRVVRSPVETAIVYAHPLAPREHAPVPVTRCG